MDRGVWQVVVHGITSVRHDLVTKPHHNSRVQKSKVYWWSKIKMLSGCISSGGSRGEFHSYFIVVVFLTFTGHLHSRAYECLPFLKSSVVNGVFLTLQHSDTPFSLPLLLERTLVVTFDQPDNPRLTLLETQLISNLNCICYSSFPLLCGITYSRFHGLVHEHFSEKIILPTSKYKCLNQLSILSINTN